MVNINIKNLMKQLAPEPEGQEPRTKNQNQNQESEPDAYFLDHWKYVNYSNKYAFAALKNDGTVSVWGASIYGGTLDNRNTYTFDVDNSVSDELNGDSSTNPVIEIYSTTGAFAALKENGSVVTWGHGLGEGGEDNYGGNSSV